MIVVLVWSGRGLSCFDEPRAMLARGLAPSRIFHSRQVKVIIDVNNVNIQDLIIIQKSRQKYKKETPTNTENTMNLHKQRVWYGAPDKGASPSPHVAPFVMSPGIYRLISIALISYFVFFVLSCHFLCDSCISHDAHPLHHYIQLICSIWPWLSMGCASQ